MDSITAETSTFENDALQVFSALSRTKPREVDYSIASIMSVEQDTRFYEETLHAVINQSVLPGTIVIADCASRVKKELVKTFSVQIEPTQLTGLISNADFSNANQTFSNAYGNAYSGNNLSLIHI